MPNENGTKKSTPPSGMANDHLTGRDIVIVTIQPWYYELGSNCKNIALELAKHNRVLYVNIPITRKTYLTANQSKGVKQHCDIIRSKSDTIRQIQENLWEFYPTSLIESINSLPFTSIFRLINKINNKRFASDIQKAIHTMQFSNIILFNDNDIYNGYHLKEYLNPALYVYYMRDFLQGYAYWKKHSTVLEPRLIRKADLVVTNSTYYAEYCSQYNSSSVYIGQGCNLELFNHHKVTTVAEELAGIGRPIIGYVGALDSARLDHAVIEKIAKANPAWQVVLVGPEDEQFKNSQLHTYKNIHFLGRQPMAKLPAFVRGFDVCMNPQSVNTITTGNYPLKIDEYLAMGKPVVATRTKAMKLFENYCYLADSAAEYPSLIATALAETSDEKAVERAAFAQQHSWENSREALYRAINQWQQPTL
jgi:teichuronic acid biosynthesis glycosyltransferase TuaH